MSINNQSERLTSQHKLSQGVVGIFGVEAKLHDLSVAQRSMLVTAELQKLYPQKLVCVFVPESKVRIPTFLGRWPEHSRSHQTLSIVIDVEILICHILRVWQPSLANMSFT